MKISEIMDALRACNDDELISDIALMAAMRLHELLVASDAIMKRNVIVMHGMHIETGNRYTVRITRDN